MPSVLNRLSLEQSPTGNWSSIEVGKGWNWPQVSNWQLLERDDCIFILPSEHWAVGKSSLGFLL